MFCRPARKRAWPVALLWQGEFYQNKKLILHNDYPASIREPISTEDTLKDYINMHLLLIREIDNGSIASGLRP